MMMALLEFVILASVMIIVPMVLFLFIVFVFYLINKLTDERRRKK